MKTAFDQLPASDGELIVVSGLTALGIPKLVYEEAVQRGLRTIGIACQKAHDNPCFDVDEFIIYGNEWGDESEFFLGYIDALVRIGGGKQSHRECDAAKTRGMPVYEYELAALSI